MIDLCLPDNGTTIAVYEQPVRGTFPTLAQAGVVVGKRDLVYVELMGRDRYWIDLGQHPDEEDVEKLVAALGRRFAVRYTTDNLGNGRLDILSIPWPYNIFPMGRQIRVRLVALLDEALPGWSGRYTFQPLLSMSNADYEWTQSTAEAIFEEEVAIEEAAGDPGGVDGARQRVAEAYAQAAERGLAAAVQRQVSVKRDARAWRIRKQREDDASPKA